jgi:hypothetical protein
MKNQHETELMLKWQSWKEMSLLARSGAKAFQSMLSSIWWIARYESTLTMHPIQKRFMND